MASESGMNLTLFDAYFVGVCLQGLFYGIYSGIFVLYIQYWQASKDDSHKTNNIIYYALCALYVLSVVNIPLGVVAHFLISDDHTLLHVYRIASTIMGFCDCISQFILIYRCWIIWGYNIRVVIIPSILMFAFLATWLATDGSWYIFYYRAVVTRWGYALSATSLITSLAVNALVTGLIVFRIFGVYREFKNLTSNNWSCMGNKTRSILFIIIESGMALFAIQLIQIVVYILQMLEAYAIILGIHQVLNGITPTIILVRVSMGLSFYDEESMVETTTSLYFSSDNLDLDTEMGSADAGHHESRDESNDIDVQPTFS